MARRRVRSGAQWRQPLLPELAEQLAESATEPPAEQPRAQVAGADWEERCFREACRAACQMAVARLEALEGHLHAQRPRGYVVEGWRERTLVTRFGDVRARRRLYTAPDGTAHFLLDEHLGWPPRQVATPAFAALLVDWATEVPFRTAARRVEAATAGVVGGRTAWRLLQQVAARVVAHEQAVHAAWAATATLPAPAGERVVPVLYVEADGVWVKTQREPDHRTGYELKCASMPVCMKAGSRSGRRRLVIRGTTTGWWPSRCTATASPAPMRRRRCRFGRRSTWRSRARMTSAKSR